MARELLAVSRISAFLASAGRRRRISGSREDSARLITPPSRFILFPTLERTSLSDPSSLILAKLSYELSARRTCKRCESDGVAHRPLLSSCALARSSLHSDEMEMKLAVASQIRSRCHFALRAPGTLRAILQRSTSERQIKNDEALI